MNGSELRVAVRTLRKQPGFSAVVILSLALAIALNTTMYSVLDALIHPRVDIREPDRLFKFRFYGDYNRHIKPTVRDSILRVGLPSVEAIAWHDPVSQFRRSVLSAGKLFVEGPVGPVSLDYMPLMGPRLIAGRWFTAADEFTTPRPIILHEQMAASLFGPKANAIGETVMLRDTAFAVIGVLSRYAEFPGNTARAWVLLSESNRKPFQANSWIARVRPGVTRAQLENDLKNVAARFAALSGDAVADDAFRIAGTTKEELRIQSLHRALIAAVVAVLLVACANVANLQLARGIARSRELALRSALGASRGRIIRHLLTESVLLSAGGLVLGLALTLWGASLLRASVPPSVGEYIVEPQLSWRVLAFALAATLACILLVGLAPALKVSRVDPNEMMKSGNGTGATRTHRRQYGYLVVAEIALALGLVSVATVTVRGALAAWDIGWQGFDVTHLAAGLYPLLDRDAKDKSLPEYFAAIQGRLNVLEGVQQTSLDVGGSFDNSGISIADSSGVRELMVPSYGFRQVTPNFIRTRGLAILSGRDFQDGERDVPAIIIDEITSRKLWPNANPIGALIKLGDVRSNRPFVRVVGVFSRVDEHGKPKPAETRDLLDGTIGTVLYLPGLRDSVPKNGPINVVVRAKGDPTPVGVVMRAAGVLRAASMESYMGLAQFRASRDFMAKMFSLFAALGLSLAVFGVYGVVAHSVAERRREFGVRIALGATSRDILHAALRESLVIALSGIALGLYFTLRGVYMVAQLSNGTDIYNAPLFAGVALTLFGAAVTSALIPARRATRVDPTESLRSE